MTKDLPKGLPRAEDYSIKRPSHVAPDVWKQDLIDARAECYNWADSLARKAKVERRDLLASEARESDACLDQVERFDGLMEAFEDELRAEFGSDPIKEQRQLSRDELRQLGERNKYAQQVVAEGMSGYAGTGAEARDGVPLRSNDTYVNWIQSRSDIDIPAEHSQLSLRKYVRGFATGDWSRADAERRAMSEGTGSIGGVLVPAPLSAQIIDLARPKSRVLQAGARMVPMASKTLDVPRWAGDPDGVWRGENDEITDSDAMLGSVKLESKTLAGLTKVSRELIEDAPGIESELLEAFAAQFALLIDRAALYGTGTGDEPTGIYETGDVSKVDLGTGDGDTPDGYGFMIDAIGQLQDDNEEPNGIILAPRTERGLARLTDNTGQPLQAPRLVYDVPRFPTNQVPTDQTVGSSSDCSDVFVGDWSRLIIGVRTQLQINVLSERYADYGQLGFLSWWRGDVAVARPEAFAVTTGVRP